MECVLLAPRCFAGGFLGLLGDCCPVLPAVYRFLVRGGRLGHLGKSVRVGPEYTAYLGDDLEVRSVITARGVKRYQYGVLGKVQVVASESACSVRCRWGAA
jgi:hypothetical protein